MKLFITKFALTTGIKEADDAEINAISRSMISVKSLGSDVYFHGEGREWHRTLDAAQAKAESMRTKKIKALLMKIKKLEAMKFGNSRLTP